MCVLAEDIGIYRNQRSFTFISKLNSYTDSLHTVRYTASDDTNHAVCCQLDNRQTDLDVPKMLV